MTENQKSFFSNHIQSVLRAVELEGSKYAKLPRPGYLPAAVLVPIFFNGMEWNFLFTKRSEIVNKHKGQVSFPGGRVEAGDADVTQTALREASEEIGLEHPDVNIYGTLPGFHTSSNYWVFPVVAEINWPIELTISSDEVSKVFSIPISWFLEIGNVKMINYVGKRGGAHKVIHYREFNGEIVWGITAKIIYDLLSLI